VRILSFEREFREKWKRQRLDRRRAVPDLYGVEAQSLARGARRHPVEAIDGGSYFARDTVVASLRFVCGLLMEPLRRWRRRRAAIRDLGALDDRLLADIGLIRGEIGAAVDDLQEGDGLVRQPPARQPCVAPSALTPYLVAERKRRRLPAAVANANRPIRSKTIAYAVERRLRILNATVSCVAGAAQA
jgi:uncharacterized protein YjiS (DUF1127 family)